MYSYLLDIVFFNEIVLFLFKFATTYSYLLLFTLIIDDIKSSINNKSQRFSYFLKHKLAYIKLIRLV